MSTPMTPADAELAAALATQAYTIRAKRGLKAPVGAAWGQQPNTTAEEARAHVAAGGNVGLIPGRSHLVVLDAENAAATDFVRAMGFKPTVITAKSGAGPTLADGSPNPKQGGSHTHLRLPADAPEELDDTPVAIELPGGGKLEVFGSTRRFVMAPPSRLDEAHGLAYTYTGADIAEAQSWLWDRTVPCPDGAELLHGVIAPPTPREKLEQSARSMELSEQIDEVPWADWIAGDHRLTPLDTVDSCGCPEYHWRGADHDKSVTFHDGCGQQGSGAHIWSGTMIAELGLNGDHVSRLDLACALRKETRSEVAASVGIQLGEEREELGRVTPAVYDRLAAHFRELGETARAELFRQAAAAMRASAPTPEERGETFTSGRVLGAPAMAPRSDEEGGGGTGSDEQPIAPVIPIFTKPSTASAAGAAPKIGTVGGPATAGANALKADTVPAGTEASGLAGLRSGAWLDEQVFAPLEYHVPGLITEGCGIIAGPPKVGKSWFVLAIALAIAAGGTALGCLNCAARPVLYLALEDGWRRLRARSRQLLGGAAIPEGIDFMLEIAEGHTAASVISEWLALYPGQKPFVVVDTLGKTRGAGPKSGASAYQEDYKALGDLKKCVDAVPGSGMLIVHHTRKSEAGKGGGRSADFVEELSGTFGLSGAADYAMVLHRDRETEGGVLAVTGRDVIERTLAMTRDADTGRWTLDGGSVDAAAAVIEESRLRPDESNLGGANQQIIAAIIAGCPNPGDTMGPKDIAAALHTTEGRIAKPLQRLSDGGYIAKPERGRYAPVAQAPGAVPPIGTLG